MKGVARLLAHAGLMVALAVPAMAQDSRDPSQTAARASEMLQTAGATLQDADSARDRVEALTETVRAYEEGLLGLRDGMRQAALRERTILLMFEAERDRLARLLGVLQAIEGSPAPLLAMHPDGPLGTARSGIIISDIAPAVIREAEALRVQIEELAMLRDLQSDALRRLSTALDEVQTARAALSQAIADRTTLPGRFAQNTEAMRRLVENVDSLDGFADMLAEAPADDLSDLPGFGAARGALPLPVIGALLRRYDEADAAGIVRPGMVLATRPSALVTAPWPATVRYAGPLLDYGNVIILEPDGMYLLVLAGLGDLYVEAGQIVSSTAPLGLMPGNAGPGDDLVRSGSADAGVGMTETLYIEVRENGRPTNPENWFAPTGWRN